jgi:hypothetical protein
MLEQAHSVIVLLTPRFSNMLLVLGLAGGDIEDAVLSSEGAMVIKPGVAVTKVHCIETGEDLTLDSDYAVFHTGKPATFVAEFVPALRTAIGMLGWPSVREKLEDFLASKD